MLRREIEERILEWKNGGAERCLIINGARQVGKTFIVKKFAAENYDFLVDINFAETPSAMKIFDGDLDIASILEGISLYSRDKTAPVPHRTLIFLDEIQLCPNARTALKFLALDGRFDVIASGSMLGLRYREVASYPTGYVDYLDMHPLSFREFLWANGVGDGITDMLKTRFETKTPVSEAAHSLLQRLFRQYVVVGGMPAVVSKFVKNHDYAEALRTQRSILRDYRDDIAKYAEGTEKIKAAACFDSIPAQLSKENKKFMYGVVEKNGKSSKYLGSVGWLTDAGIACACRNLSALEEPLAAYRQDDRFKIYMADTGLLVAMLDDGTNARIIEGDLGIYKGAVFENVVAQILSQKGHDLYYYNRNNTLEIDFVISSGGRVMPIEAKTGSKAKSLATILRERPGLEGIKLTGGNVGSAGNLTVLPQYMAMFL